MTSSKFKQILFFQVLVSFIIIAVSCNSKTNDDESEIAVTPALVAVKNFYIKKNDSVMAKMDSVFFSIDLNSGVIFNADSLPKGTNVTRLIPSITFANTMTKADITFLKDNLQDTTVNYLKNPEDSIDFTHPVLLEVTAADGTSEFKYQIKVNVHQQDPDTLVWDKLSISELPARYTHPVAQKTTFSDPVTYSLIEEYNGEITLATSQNLNKGEWQKERISLGFQPKIESFTVTPDNFWLLDDQGNLYNSKDGIEWNVEAESWITIIGAFGNSILGIREVNQNYLYTQYPSTEVNIEQSVDKDFPLAGFSSLGVVKNEWADTDFALLMGGTTSEGELSSDVWAFDGENWAIINQNYLPKLNNPLLARYVVYRDTPYLFTKRALDVWLLFGGSDSDNKINREVYLSYDNGVHWSLAPEMLQLPESLPVLNMADIVVAGYNISADLSDAWTYQDYTPGTRSSYVIDGFDITWICPYLYLFGGYNEDNLLSTTIWRGVLSRLTFVPLI